MRDLGLINLFGFPHLKHRVIEGFNSELFIRILKRIVVKNCSEYMVTGGC